MLGCLYNGLLRGEVKGRYDGFRSQKSKAEGGGVEDR